MTEDTSLSEFLNADAEDDGATATDTDGSESTADEERSAPAVTFAWNEGSVCPECEATVERRWIDDDRLVCAQCKQW